jgi:hypothetical protein
MNYKNITAACYHKRILKLKDFHFMPYCNELHLLRICTLNAYRKGIFVNNPFTALKPDIIPADALESVDCCEPSSRGAPSGPVVTTDVTEPGAAGVTFVGVVPAT